MTLKKWQLMPAIGENFVYKYPQYEPLTLQLLYNRRLTEKKDIEDFLSPDFDKLTHDPYKFRQMTDAVSTIIDHIKKRKKILVYGDYDADGVTSSALLVEILGILKADVDVYIPHRVTEGYGLNIEALNSIAKDKVKLIITVDTGIRNKTEVKIASKMGIAVVITDHHLPPERGSDLPDCLIIDPAIKGEEYPYKKLAGVGVAYKLALALVVKSKLPEKTKMILLDKIMDLVVIGTVADCASVMGENRVLLKYGLKLLNKTSRIGLQELIKLSGLDNGKQLDTWNIGFQIAPRLNAAGRMGSANTSFELLTTSDRKKAKDLAQRLNDRNIDRQNQTEEIFNAVEKQIKSQEKNKLLIGVCPVDNKGSDEDWNEGVIGLVAGKIAQKYYLPTLVITKNEDGYKGSGRSIPEFNLAQAIEKCSDLLLKYGGHPAACGFSLKEKNLELFINRMLDIASHSLAKSDLHPKVRIEAILKPEAIDEQLIRGLENFMPYGQQNERPVFASYGVKIYQIFTMGVEKQHIKLRIKDDSSGMLSAIGFGQAEKWRNSKIGDLIDIAYYLEMNKFNGLSEPQLKIIDIKTNK